MNKAETEAVEAIIDAGFSHLKIELEADIGREGSGICTTCDGTGYEQCAYCDGLGYTEDRESGTTLRLECDDCYGDAEFSCETCDGRGERHQYFEDRDCRRLLEDNLSDEIMDKIVYRRFYNDGSVDSEYTFTIKTEDADIVPEVIQAFKDMAYKMNGHIDVAGAGMHIATLTDGNYPSGQSRLNSDGTRNFSRQVTKLLPALYFVASSNHQSRELNYRNPRISSHDKYSAIYTRDNTIFEYRLFETCYDHPERFYDYVQVIANTLKYYSDPSLEIKSLGEEFYFNDDSNNVARFYNTTEQLRILNATIKHVKPKGKSFKTLKKERGVRYTITELKKREKARVARLKEDYKEYIEHRKTLLSADLSPSQERELDYLLTEADLHPDDAEARVRGISANTTTFEEFVNNNLNNRSGQYITV